MRREERREKREERKWERDASTGSATGEERKKLIIHNYINPITASILPV
jgi:hypothetical protein